MLHPLLCRDLALLPDPRQAGHAWDEWRVLGYFYFAEKTLFARLDLLTQRANTALTLAVCEWIEAWLSAFTGDRTLAAYIEAGWPAQMDPRHTEFFGIVDDEWRGPILGPSVIAIGIINEVFYQSFEEPRMAFRSCYAINLARHLFGRLDAFESWLERSIRRLESHHSQQAEPKSPTDLLAREFPKGALVAREAFDPARPYHPDQAADLLLRQAERIGPENPFYDRLARHEHSH